LGMSDMQQLDSTSNGAATFGIMTLVRMTQGRMTLGRKAPTG
jgi:hypothetical protein